MPSPWIAYRLAALCADGNGRVPGGRILLDRAARVALLIDLAFLGRVTGSSDRTEIDTAPTGFGPADGLLRYVDEHPDQTMGEVLARCPVGLVDVADPNRSRDRRWRPKRAATIPADIAVAERAQFEGAQQLGPDSEATAALVEILAALGLAAGDPDGVIRCGLVTWLVADCVAYLNDVRTRFAQGNADAAAWQSANFIM